MSPREENSPKVTSQQGAEVLWEPSPTPSPCRQGSWSFGGELHSAFPVSSLDLTASEGGGAGRGAGGGSGSQRACAPGASPACSLWSDQWFHCSWDAFVFPFWFPLSPSHFRFSQVGLEWPRALLGALPGDCGGDTHSLDLGKMCRGGCQSPPCHFPPSSCPPRADRGVRAGALSCWARPLRSQSWWRKSWSG